MKQFSKSTLIVILMMILIVVAAGVTGLGVYFQLGKNFKSSKEILEKEILDLKETLARLQEELQSLQNSKDKTANFKTYINQKDNYSLKYPPGEWYVTSSEEGLVITNFKYTNQKPGELTSAQVKIVISVEKHRSNLPLQDFILSTPELGEYDPKLTQVDLE